MELAEYRKGRGLSQESCAAELDLRSKSYVSMLEQGRVASPLSLALQIESWSDGEVPAVGLLAAADRDLLEAHDARLRAGRLAPLTAPEGVHP